MSTQCLFWALKLKVGNPYQKLILVSLADICNENRQCWPSHQYLAERAECSRRSVIRHLSELEKKGLISVRRRADSGGLKSSSVYSLPDVTESHIDVTESHRGSDRESHNTPIDTPDYINSDSWGEWITYLKEKRKTPTPSTIKKQQAMLKAYDKPIQQQIINQSIQNGWQGLFAPKESGSAEDRSRRNPAAPGRKLTPAERVKARHAERYGSKSAGEAPVVDAVVSIQ